ncbi:MAG TPA: hypothetical protein VIV60_11645 [Polyangiaceae bacterium]
MYSPARTAQGCLLIASLALVGCASDDNATTSKPSDGNQHVNSTDPTGVYNDDFGISHRIAAPAWNVGDDVFTFVAFDAEDDQLVAQNAATNAYFPGLYSRFDWATDADGRLRYCQTVYNAESATAATSVARADESDWEKGCAGFAWSTLTGPSILGSYLDSYQGSHVITAAAWVMGGQGASTFHLLVLSNAQRYLIAENDAANPYNPSKFSRFDWLSDETGALYYCQTAYAAESAAAALAVPAAVESDLAKGCAGFPWTKLVPAV